MAADMLFPSRSPTIRSSAIIEVFNLQTSGRIVVTGGLPPKTTFGFSLSPAWATLAKVPRSLCLIFLRSISLLVVVIFIQWFPFVLHSRNATNIISCARRNCYLPTGNSSAISMQTKIIMQGVFEFAATLPKAPVFILGDFQDPPGSNSSVAQALCSGEWVDVLDAFCAAHQQPIPNSYQRISDGKTQESRIDYILANSAACAHVRDAACIVDSGFPDHRPASVRCIFEDVPDRAYFLKGCEQWEFSEAPKSLQAWNVRDEHVKKVLAPHLHGL